MGEEEGAAPAASHGPAALQSCSRSLSAHVCLVRNLYCACAFVVNTYSRHGVLFCIVCLGYIPYTVCIVVGAICIVVTGGIHDLTLTMGCVYSS